MYSIPGYGSMIADSVRMRAYVEALKRLVQPDSVVLDIGTGTGIIALLAASMGARRVFAIEPSDVIVLAKEAARANSLSDRIVFLQELSTRITLQQKADIIISDLRGVLPFFATNIQSVIDARERLLAPGGALIPQRDRLWLTVLNSQKFYDRVAAPWMNYDGIDLTTVGNKAVNLWSKIRITPEDVILNPQIWCEIDYTNVTSPNAAAEVEWSVEEDSVGHGLGVWFDSDLSDSISMTNSPFEPELIYGNAYFPWPEPVNLMAGDTLRVRLSADFVREDYVWSWETIVSAQGSEKKHFRQSTFYGTALSPAKLKKRAANFLPRLNNEGKVDLFILERMQEEHSLQEIAESALAEFPDDISDLTEALTRVGELSSRYST